jgi:hypothetical protein
MTYMREGEAGNASIRLGPEHITVGGHATQPVNMSYSREDFVDYSQNLSKGLENVTEAEKREAAEEVIYEIWNLVDTYPQLKLVISADITVVAAFIFFRILPPPQYLALLAAANVVVFHSLGTSVAVIIKKADVALDPEGEVYITRG